MLTFSMDALFIRGMRKHRHLGTLRCRQEGASTPSIRDCRFRPETEVRRDCLDVAYRRRMADRANRLWIGKDPVFRDILLELQVLNVDRCLGVEVVRRRYREKERRISLTTRISAAARSKEWCVATWTFTPAVRVRVRRKRDRSARYQAAPTRSVRHGGVI